MPGSTRTDWFTTARFGMFIHYGLYSLAARHEWVRGTEKLTAEQYRRYLEAFDPDLFDADALVAQAVRMGAEYVVLTTKHHEGFCLWDSAQTDYTAAAACGRDLVREFVDAVRAAGLRVGLYHSLIDWDHPDFTVDYHHPLRDGDPAELNASRSMDRYRAYLHAQVRELLTGYGQIDLMFYDFTYPDPRDGVPGKTPEDWDAAALLAMTRELQPQAVVNNRLGISADYITPEQHQPTEPIVIDGQPVVWEACHTINGSWGFDRDNLEFKDPGMLVRMLVETVANDGNLILNVGPNGRGAIERRDRETLDAIGEWVRLHESSIRGAGHARFAPAPNCLYTRREGRLYVHVLAWPLRHLHLPGLGDRVRYARLLDTGSEVKILRPDSRPTELGDHTAPYAPPPGTLTLELPITRPDVLVPVIELFLDED